MNANTILRTLLAAALSLGTTHASARAEGEAPAALAIGATAPLNDVMMKNVDGRSLSIAQAAGKKGTLVIFICNHCPWVQAWQTRIAALGNDALKRGVGVIAVNSNDPSAYTEDAYEPMQQRAKDVGYHFPYVVDATSEVARAFGASHTPEAYLFNARGKLVYHGAVDDNAQHEDAVKQRWLAQAVTAVAAGKAPSTNETKALGCGIKFREKSAD